MPQVNITYKDGVSEDELESLLDALTETLVLQLSCELHEDELDGKMLTIKPDMVKIQFHKASPLDRRMKDVHIDIEARNFRERLRRLNTYAPELFAVIAPFFSPNTSISIFYKLCAAGWSAGHGTAEPELEDQPAPESDGQPASEGHPEGRAVAARAA